MRHGADQFARSWSASAVVVAFRIGGRYVKMALPVPDRADYRLTPTNIRRTDAQRDAAYDKEIRRRWRCLLAVVKAKLVAVEDGISTLEREFMADVLLPDGTTLGEWVQPQIERAYSTGRMTDMLEIGSGR